MPPGCYASGLLASCHQASWLLVFWLHANRLLGCWSAEFMPKTVRLLVCLIHAQRLLGCWSADFMPPGC
ncbi:hypothetical protein DPMN_048383 [Dreissena polymorpha]|uniref:Uncharacterized protein n=1 Tax=Dreissena polymorpha TaxID=45954 RepID=A0A9D4D9X6_DREPO|nr:hypothetical protein DPMN_048383 [Dreissena polymorpha]